MKFSKSANEQGKAVKKGRPKKALTSKVNETKKSNTGRKRKSFQESSVRTKRRKVSELRKNMSPEFLIKAVKPLLETYNMKGRYSPDEALALFFEAKLSKESYNVLTLN